MKYAGMTDVVNKIGNEVKIKASYLSYPMNMVEAVPDEEDLVGVIDSLIKKEKTGENLKKYEEYYGSWDKSYLVFLNVIKSLPEKSWNKVNIEYPNKYVELNVSNEDYVKFLITEVLREPELIGSYLMTRIINDLNSGITFGGICGNYFTENIDQRNYLQFDRKKAYDICLNRKAFNDSYQNILNNEL